MNGADVENALTITPHFYRAALDFTLWPEVLARFSSAFRSRGSQVNVAKLQTDEIIAAAHHGFDEKTMRAYLAIESHEAVDPRIQRARHRPNMPFCERQIMSAEEWHQSRIFREVIGANGYDSSLVVFTVLEEEGVLAILGTTRGMSDPPFDDADVETFQLYLPHFREAMRVAARLHGLEQRGRTFAAMFDQLRIATLITDRFGQVEYQNEAARIVLTRSTALSIVHGRIVANGGAANSALHEAIFNAAAGGTKNGTARELLRIERPERDSGILISVASSGGQPGAGLPVGAQLRATLFLCDPEARYEGDAEALQRLFGLTNAEATVMVLLSAGHAPKAIAAQLGRSYETVRSHLKVLFAKTGAKTQAELVALVHTVAPPAPG